jgi:biotin carboxyl carrier protein
MDLSKHNDPVISFLADCTNDTLVNQLTALFSDKRDSDLARLQARFEALQIVNRDLCHQLQSGKERFDHLQHLFTDTSKLLIKEAIKDQIDFDRLNIETRKLLEKYDEISGVEVTKDTLPKRGALPLQYTSPTTKKNEQITPSQPTALKDEKKRITVLFNCPAGYKTQVDKTFHMPGDRVEVGEVIFKTAITQVKAPYSGVLERFLVWEGRSVENGTPMAIIAIN